MTSNCLEKSILREFKERDILGLIAQTIFRKGEMGRAGSLPRLMKNACEKAIEILQITDDGDKLSPVDLKLLEMAVNGWLNETGEVAFDDLYNRVSGGAYSPPWFHGIEHLTIDHVGYVYWKGRAVEHYTPSWAYSDDAKKHALELAERCRHLERIGVEANTTNAIWKWEQFEACSGGR